MLSGQVFDRFGQIHSSINYNMEPKMLHKIFWWL